MTNKPRSYCCPICDAVIAQVEKAYLSGVQCIGCTHTLWIDRENEFVSPVWCLSSRSDPNGFVLTEFPVKYVPQSFSPTTFPNLGKGMFPISQQPLVFVYTAPVLSEIQEIIGNLRFILNRDIFLIRVSDETIARLSGIQRN